MNSVASSQQLADPNLSTIITYSSLTVLSQIQLETMQYFDTEDDLASVNCLKCKPKHSDFSHLVAVPTLSTMHFNS